MVIANHAYIMLEDNSVWSIGDNDLGQCGRSSDRVGRFYNASKILEDIIDISVGAKHGIFIDWKGRLLVVGSNKSGQCGTTNPFEDSPIEVPCYINNVKVVFYNCSAGRNHSAAVDSNGNLWVCGANDFGQCGPTENPDKSNIIRRWEIVKIYSPSGTLIKWHSVTCGENHTMLVTQDRRYIYTMGNNSENELGIGHSVFERGPVITLEAHAEFTVDKLANLRNSGLLTTSTVLTSLNDIQWYDINSAGRAILANGDLVLADGSGLPVGDYDGSQTLIKPRSLAPQDRFGKNFFLKSLTISKTNIVLENDGTLWVWGYWEGEKISWPRKVFENVLDFKVTGKNIYVLLYNDDVTTNVYRVALPEWRDNRTRYLAQEDELIFNEQSRNKVKKVTSSLFLKIKLDGDSWERVY